MTIETALHWGREWQRKGGAELLHHTLDPANAARIAAGYVALLRGIFGGFDMAGLRGLGIGSGAGHLEAAIDCLGLPMTVSEWNDDGVTLLAREVPTLPRRLIDVATFDDDGVWDVIVCRELYPFTRVSDFPAQMALIRRMLVALRHGGVLLLVGSDVSHPNCLDYAAMCRDLRAEGFDVRKPVLEPVVKRAAALRSAGTIAALSAAAEVALWARNLLPRPRVAGIRIFPIRRP